MIPTCPGCYLPMSDRHHAFREWSPGRVRAYCDGARYSVESPITDQELLRDLMEGNPLNR